MLWNEDVNEVVMDFLRSSFSPQAAEELLDNVYYGAYEILYVPADAAHILLVHSNSEYPFTPNDLFWLGYAATVLSYKVKETGKCVFFFDIDCSREDYYLVCAAIIKVFNKAFSIGNLFIFKIGDAIAIGSARDFDNHEDTDFALSGLVSAENINEYEGLFDSLCYSDLIDFPSIIISYSPQEREDNLSLDRSRPNPDYLSFLSEFQSQYGIDTSRERQLYINESENSIIAGSHSYVRKQLAGVADSDLVSSYEVLDTATEAEEKSEKVRFEQVDYNFQNEDVESSYSKEAFDNAEQMLKEMLGERPKKEESQ